MKQAARIAGLTFALVVMTLNLSFAAPLTIATNLTSSGDITLTAPDTPAAGDNLIVVSGVTVATTGGNITLNVGDDLTLAPGSTVMASGNVTIILDAGNADAGVGSIATLAGQIIGQHVTIAGGPDVDSLVFQGPAAVVTFTGAQSGTISAPGMTDIIFANIENISGNVTFAPVPEPSSWLLIASSGVAGLVWRVLRRFGRGDGHADRQN
jgi:PEP-CTERM motif